jgi:hypothetical protein
MKTLTIRVVEGASGDYEVTIDPAPEGAAGQPPVIVPRVWVRPETDIAEPEIRRYMLGDLGVDGAFRRIGAQLRRFLSRGWVGEQWEKHRESDVPFRTFLDIRPKELAVLPWELMYDEGSLKRLFLERTRPISRIVGNYASAEPAAPMAWPIRILVVVGSLPKAKEVDAEAEVAAIREVFRDRDRMIHLVVPKECPASPLELRDWLVKVRPHVFHFIGHGGAGGGPDANLAELVFQPTKAGAGMWGWTPGRIIQDFSTLPVRPRLVVLNACRTAVEGGAEAAANPYDAESAWSIADAFIQANVPAVIANQADARGKLAGAFSRAFYEALAEPTSLDEAVVRGRDAVRGADANGMDRRDWALPVLTLARPPECILPIQPQVPRPLAERIEDCDPFKVVSFFVDRNELRLGCQTFHHDPGETGETRNVLIVHGQPDVGKTTLVDWCLEGCAAQGFSVRQVDLTEGRCQNWLDVLRLIRDGNESLEPKGFVYKPLPRRSFDEFNWKLNHYLAGKDAPPFKDRPSPDEPVIDAMAPLDPNQVTNERAEMLWKDYREALADAAGRSYMDALDEVPPGDQDAVRRHHQALFEAAGGWPLFLVLDRFDASLLPPGQFQILWNQLFSKIGQEYAAGKRTGLGAIRLILVQSDDDRIKYALKPSDLRKYCRDVEVKNLPIQDFDELIREYFVKKRKPELIPGVLSMVEAKKMTKPNFIPDPWSPAVLQLIFDWAIQLEMLTFHG